MRSTSRVILAGTASLLLLTGSARAANKVAGGVLGNGATPSAGSAANGHVLLGTAGQPAVGASGSGAKDLCPGFWCAGGVRVLGVDDGPGGSHAPDALVVSRPWPDPMTDRMTVSLSLPHAADVRMQLLDVQGRLAGGMHAGFLAPGVYRLEWDGTDGEGHVAGAGVYFVRTLVDGRPVTTRRLVRLH